LDYVAEAVGQETPTLEPATMRRLAFIRYLYTLGLDQLTKPEPLSSAAILMFHDSVELFLQLAAEHVDAGTRSGFSFLEYWDALASKVEGGVTQKEAMRRLNSSRVGLKHHGTHPTALDLDSFRDVTERFFVENTPRVFGVEFSEVSLVDLVWNTDVRDRLSVAREAVEQGDVPAALAASAIAFRALVDDYERRKQGEFGRSPFFFGEDMTFQTSFFMGLTGFSGRGFSGGDPKMAKFVDNVNDSLGALRDAVKLLSFGLDYRRYVRFRLLTPEVFRTLNDPDWKSHALPGGTHAPTAADAEFCMDFVIESALRLQEFDFSVELAR
jgi:hypothetical protein